MNGSKQLWLQTAAIIIGILGPGIYGFFDLREQVHVTEGLRTIDSKRIEALESAAAILRDRQALRIPVFDRMVIEVDEHEIRIRKLEQDTSRGPR